MGCAAVLLCSSAAVNAAELSVASSNIGNGLKLLRSQINEFEARTGHKVSLVPMPDSSSDQFSQYKIWLSAQSGDVDVYLTDVIWAPQLADHFVDLANAAISIQSDYLPALIDSQTVAGKLVALPLFTSVPALFYRRDLLQKHGLAVPSTWEELGSSAKLIMDGERAHGNSDLWGYVFQASSYEGLTANTLEWIISSGGGSVIADDGSITINQDEAAKALDLAANWVGSISPPGVLGYTEEEGRGVWQLGNAAFMRNWPYAWTLGNFDDSLVKGRFGVAPLPSGSADGRSVATLGGWNVAVSKYSDQQQAAVELALFLVEPENQKQRLFFSGDLPALASLYTDPEILAANPMMADWRAILSGAVARPSAIAKAAYNEASAAIWTAAHNSLSNPGTASDNVEVLALQLEELRGEGW